VGFLMAGVTESFSIGHPSFIIGMAQYYMIHAGRVMHACRKDTADMHLSSKESEGEENLCEESPWQVFWEHERVVLKWDQH